MDITTQESGMTAVFEIPQGLSNASIDVRSRVLNLATGDTVDLYFQTSSDGGSTWRDVVHFPQITPTSPRGFSAKWSATLRDTDDQIQTLGDGVLPPNTVANGPIGSLARYKYVIVLGGTVKPIVEMTTSESFVTAAVPVAQCLPAPSTVVPSNPHPLYYPCWPAYWR